MKRIAAFSLVSVLLVRPAEAQSTPSAEVLQLSDALRMAVENSPQLDMARAEVEQSEAEVDEAHVLLYPRLDLSAAYSRIGGFDDGQIAVGDAEGQASARVLANTVEDPAARALWLGQLDTPASISIAVPRNRTTLRARVQWSVTDAFLRIRPSVQAAEANTTANEAEQNIVLSALRFSVHNAYLGLVRASRAHALAQSYERRAQARATEITAAVRAGLLLDIDRLQAEAQLADAQQAVVDAETSVELAEVSLRSLVGLDDAAEVHVQPPREDAVSVPRELTDEVLQAAIARRAELVALRARKHAAERVRELSGAGAYPRVSIFAGAEYSNPNPVQIPPTNEFTPSWEVGLQVSWSPNDLVTARRASSVAGAAEVALDSHIEQLERMVRIEVRHAFARAGAAQRRMDAADASVNATRASHEARQTAWRAGASTTNDVLDAEQASTAAQLRRNDAEVESALADVALAHAMGTL